MGVVLDTSVVSKLFFNERGSIEAMELVELLNNNDMIFHASDLLLYEIGKVAERKLKDKEGAPIVYPNWVFGLELHLHSPQMPLLRTAMDLTSRYGITFHDACHLSVAEMMKYPLITEDTELVEKCHRAISIEEALVKFKDMFM
jgi:predicted nucleic acid-binding protein